MRKIYLIIASVSLLLLITGFVNYSKPVYTNIPTNAFGTGTVIDAARFSDWIGGVTPVVNVFVKPADGPSFVGDNYPVTTSTFDRQDFHRWSQQMFYWLLSPVPRDGSYGNCSGLVMNSPAFFDVSGSSYIRHKCGDVSKNNMSFDVKSTQNGKHNLPLFFERDTEKVFDIDVTPKSANGYQLVQDDKGNKIEVSKIIVKENRPIFYNRQGKIIEKVTLIFGEKLNEKTTMQQFLFNNKIFNIALASKFSPIIIFPTVAQASLNGTSNVLMARNGSLVYYNIMVNDIFAVFSQMTGNGTLPFESKFPTTIQELIAIKDYAAANNIPIIDTDDRVLAMELKTSWVEVTNLTNPNDYVKTTATVPNYVQTSPGAWTRSGTRSTTLALVGIHVVGSVLGHPEMIWSTFEHINNTPNSSYSFRNNSGGISNSVADDTSTDFLFSRPRTATYIPTFNVPRITGSWNLTSTNGSTISNSDTRRNIPFGWGGQIPTGGNPNGTNPVDVMFVEDSNAQLVAINTDGKNRLVGTDVRKKYFQVGSTWSSNFVENQQAGTIRLSNSTMETYTQATTGNINSTTGAGLNCFSCHDAGFGTSNPDGFQIPGPNEKFLSHVFGYNLIP